MPANTIIFKYALKRVYLKMGEHKVLIIKPGYSEILDDRNNSRKVSLGDVLRTTVILHAFRDEEVTWVTDKEAFPLLEGNKYIKRLLPYDFTTVLQIEAEEFDFVINLEKVPGICAWADKVRAWKKFGFRFDSRHGRAEAYDRAFEVLAVSSDQESKRMNERTTQELLFEMIGQKWKGEEYVLGHNPTTSEMFDVGLNTQIGQKWPSKAWPLKNWDSLEKRLVGEGYRVTRQDKQDEKILSDLNSYIDWINSSKAIISNDSLGLHLAIALKKTTLGLFGPTPHREVYFYERGKPLLPEPLLDCIPCFKGKCDKDTQCMETISPERVYLEAKSYLK